MKVFTKGPNLSTFLQFSKWKKIDILALFFFWCFGCLFLWNNSVISGNGHQSIAAHISNETATAFNLTPLCHDIAHNLALNAIRAKLNEFRPTRRVMKKYQEKTLHDWEVNECPDKALLGVAYGVNTFSLHESFKRQGMKL